MHFITKIIDKNSEVILVADVNEHSIKEILLKELKKIGMVDSFIKKFNVSGPVSHMTGSKLIDRV